MLGLCSPSQWEGGSHLPSPAPPHRTAPPPPPPRQRMGGLSPRKRFGALQPKWTSSFPPAHRASARGGLGERGCPVAAGVTQQAKGPRAGAE